MSHQLIFPDVPVGTTIGPVEEAFNNDITGAVITATLRSSLNLSYAEAEATNIAQPADPNDDGHILIAWWQLDTIGLASDRYWLDVRIERNGLVEPLYPRQQIQLLPE